VRRSREEGDSVSRSIDCKLLILIGRQMDLGMS
jgi:hypothetical protein